MKISSMLMPCFGLLLLSSCEASRIKNRLSFEGVAVSDGKVYATLQSTLDIAGQTKKIADFIRLLEYDPASGATRMFAYPIDAKSYSKNSDAKLGDANHGTQTRERFFFVLNENNSREFVNRCKEEKQRAYFKDQT